MSGCCVYGCTNRYSTGGLKFYRIPKGSHPFQSNRRRLWLQAIQRVDWNEDIIKNARVCSAHFISGEMSLDSSSPDFVPSVFPYTKQSQKPGGKTLRYRRRRRRRDDRPGTAANQRVPVETPEQECSMDHCPGVLQDLYREMRRSNAEWTCVKCRDMNATERSSATGDHPPAPCMPSPVAPLSPTGNNASMEESLQEAVMEPTVSEDQPVVPTYEVVEAGTKRGRPQLIDNFGYCFGVVYSGPSAVTWRCTVRPKGAVCRAKVVERDGVFEAGPYLHNHGPNLGAATAVKVAARVKKEATSDLFKSAAVIVQEVLLDELQEDVHCPALPKPAALARAANRHRQKMRPCEPKDLNFVVDMDHIPPSFLRGDVRVSGDNERRHLIFATDTQLTHLANAKTWYLDGTFKLCRPPFMQLLAISAFVRKDDCTKSVPLIFVLMSRRQKKDYKRVLREILDILPTPPKVTRAMQDFEKALWSAMTSVLPHVRLTGCMFHWTQAVFHKIQELGLQTTYMQRGGAHEFLRDVTSLPFLPAEHITVVWERLKSRASTPGLQTFTRYMDNTWMNSSIHPPTTWSVFKKTVRTNSDVEGWHAALNRRASGKSNLPFYILVSLLQKEALLVHLSIKLVREKKLSRTQRLGNRLLQERLFDAWTRFEKGELSADGLLRSCHCFAQELCAFSFHL